MKSKHLAKPAPLIGALLALAALSAPAAQATTPAPGYENFAGCPSPAENPQVVFCFRATIKSGHFQMGSKNVPITKPIVLSGGLEHGSAAFTATNQGGLSKAREEVPGGLVGLTGLDWLVNALNAEALKVYAVTELAGTPSSPLFDPIELPIKVHLENPVIGNNCYVGSNTKPIRLNLTYGTTNPPSPNKPITGHEPIIESEPQPGVYLAPGGTLVDNAFAAPAASGCRLDLGLLHIGIDNLVNLQSGLPSPAGTNETVQNEDTEIADPAFVYP